MSRGPGRNCNARRIARRLRHDFQLFAKRIGQPREPALLHPQRQVLPFNITRSKSATGSPLTRGTRGVETRT